MTTEQAQQIADLLNSRNRLTIPYTTDRVKASEDDYVFECEGDEVFACVQVKKVQWYQSEILHLSVRSDHEGKGWGKRMIARAEQKAKEQKFPTTYSKRCSDGGLPGVKRQRPTAVSIF